MFVCLFRYVAIRVDRRRTGDSQGLFDDDEYSQQEMKDEREILQWIERVPTRTEEIY